MRDSLRFEWRVLPVADVDIPVEEVLVKLLEVVVVGVVT